MLRWKLSHMTLQMMASYLFHIGVKWTVPSGTVAALNAQAITNEPVCITMIAYKRYQPCRDLLALNESFGWNKNNLHTFDETS
jgi:hypothetical protein